MASFYNAADKKLYEKYKYLPQEKYRLGLTLPTDATEDEVVTDQGIVNTNAFANTGGGGDNFSVYNPDPNTISNQDYDPFPYRQAAEMNLIGSGDSQFDINKYGTGFRTKTEANKFMDMYPEYYRGDDDE